MATISVNGCFMFSYWGSWQISENTILSKSFQIFLKSVKYIIEKNVAKLTIFLHLMWPNWPHFFQIYAIDLRSLKGCSYLKSAENLTMKIFKVCATKLTDEINFSRTFVLFLNFEKQWKAFSYHWLVFNYSWSRRYWHSGQQ